MKILILIFLNFTTLTSSANTLTSFYVENTERILFAGEKHTLDTARNIFKESLIEFRQSGGDSLGLEMIESQMQYLLDDFLSRRDHSIERLSQYLTVRWKYNTVNYMDLLIEARDLGLKLKAIDLDKTKWPSETALFPVNPLISKVRAAREAHMAKVLCNYDFKRIIVLIGSIHAKKNFLPEGLLNECKGSSASFFISEL